MPADWTHERGRDGATSLAAARGRATPPANAVAAGRPADAHRHTHSATSKQASWFMHQPPTRLPALVPVASERVPP
eukprot:3690767-Prymnesium_polylepis.1